MLADSWWCWLFILFVIAAFAFGLDCVDGSACMLVLLLVSLGFNSVGDCLYILGICCVFDVCDLIIMAVYGLYELFDYCVLWFVWLLVLWCCWLVVCVLICCCVGFWLVVLVGFGGLWDCYGVV